MNGTRQSSVNESTSRQSLCVLCGSVVNAPGPLRQTYQCISKSGPAVGQFLTAGATTFFTAALGSARSRDGWGAQVWAGFSLSPKLFCPAWVSHKWRELRT